MRVNAYFAALPGSFPISRLLMNQRFTQRVTLALLLLRASLPSSASAQTPAIDSLRRQLTVQGDTAHSRLYGDLSAEYWYKDPRESLRYALLSRRAARTQHQPVAEAHALRSIGSAYMFMADYPNATRYFLQSLTRCQQLGSLSGQVSANNNLAVLYMNLKKYPEAMRYTRQALALQERTGQPEKAGNQYVNLSICYLKEKNYPAALAAAQKARALFQRAGVVREQGSVVGNIGVIYEEQHQLPEAQRAYLEALAVYRRLGEKRLMASVLVNLAVVAHKLGQDAQSLAYLQQARQVGRAFPQARSSVEFNFAELYADMGRFQPAYEHFRAYHALNDSLAGASQTTAIAELRSKYELAQKEQAIALLTARNHAKDLQLSRNRLALLAAATVAGLLLLVALAFYLRYRLKQQANAQLAEANAAIRRSVAEKELLIQEVHHRVKNNLQLVSSLLSWQTENVHDEQVLRIVDEGRARVKSIALIHEYLYRSDNLALISTRAYLQGLLGYLASSYRRDDSIELSSELDELHLDAELMARVGLMVNELVSNALKYAFPGGRGGRVHVAFRARGAGQLELSVADDGVGLPAALPALLGDSLGLQLVETLVRQLKGQLSFANEPGAHFRIVFEVPARPAAALTSTPAPSAAHAYA